MPCTDDGYPHHDESSERLEREACRARWLALRLAKQLGEAVDPELLPVLKKVRAEQLRHRKEDLEAQQVEARSELEDVSADMREVVQRGGEVGETLYARQDRARKRLARLKKVTDEQLLATRGKL